MSFVQQITSAPRSLITFLREAKEELGKVSWPTREATLRYTVIIVIVSLAVGVVTGGIDYLFALLIEQVV
jgi:preprotein translocase SecE subunit